MREKRYSEIIHRGNNPDNERNTTERKEPEQ